MNNENIILIHNKHNMSIHKNTHFKWPCMWLNVTQYDHTTHYPYPIVRPFMTVFECG